MFIRNELPRRQFRVNLLQRCLQTSSIGLYQLISNIRIFEFTCLGTPYIRIWVFLGTPYFRSYGLFQSFLCTFYIRYSGIALPPNIEYRIWQFPYSIFNIVNSNIEVRISNIENVLKKEKSNLAILSLYSLMIICPNIEYGDRKRQKSLYSMMEEHQNIEFSDKLAIFDIQLRNFEYTGRFPYIRSYGASTPISDFTGRGHFVTYIRYSGTK